MSNRGAMRQFVITQEVSRASGDALVIASTNCEAIHDDFNFWIASVSTPRNDGLPGPLCRFVMTRAVSLRAVLREAIQRIIAFLFFLCALPCYAESQLNVFVWADYIPDSVIQQFSSETGISVNTNQYTNTEEMYAKLKINQKPGYDIILIPSGYVTRMREEHMLHALHNMHVPNVVYANNF